MKKLAEALKNHSKDEIVVTDVLRGFVNLSAASKNKRRLVIVSISIWCWPDSSQEALDLTINTIEHFEANPKIVLLGLSVLQNIASGELDETVKHKLAFFVLNAMAKHINIKVWLTPSFA